MRKFQFNLQRLLDYKRTVEDALLVDLAAIRAEYGRERERLLDLIDDRDSFTRRMRQTIAHGDPEKIKEAYCYVQDLASLIAGQEETVREVGARKDRKTAEVLEASKERKALDRLKEHREGEHLTEEMRLAQGFLDEFAAIRSSRVVEHIGGTP